MLFRYARSEDLQRRRRRWAALIATGLLGGWAAWLVLARVGVYEVSRTARLEVESAPHAVDAPVGGYMSVDQAPNGVIYLIGSRLNFAACNEAWVREGKPWKAKK